MKWLVSRKTSYIKLGRRKYQKSEQLARYYELRKLNTREGYGDDSFQRELIPIELNRDPAKLYLEDIMARLREEEQFRAFRNKYAAFCREAAERENLYGFRIPADDLPNQSSKKL